MEPLFVILIVVAIGGMIAYGFYAKAKRRQALRAWAQAKGYRFEPGRERIEGRYPGFRCLRQGSNRYAYNRVAGAWNGRPLHAFDYHYETHSTDSKGNRRTHHHTFSALVLDNDFPLKPLFLRPEGFFDKVKDFFGFDDIDFESAEFSRRFHVSAEDKRWAFDVIHARTMQFLLDQPHFSIQFDGPHAIAFRSQTFGPEEFESAAAVLDGVLSELPDYVVQGRLSESCGGNA